MCFFLFKFFFRIAWRLAPSRSLVDKVFVIYLRELEAQRQFDICRNRDKELAKCVRPTAKTNERLIAADHRDRRRYSDYDDSQNYHDNSKGGGLYFC